MLPRSGLGAPLLIAASCLLQPAAQAEEVERPQSDETTANNPLSIVPAIQVQNYVQPLLKGAAGSGINQPLFRAIMPFDAFGGKNLLRFSAPMGTSAWDPGGKVVGLGDLTLFSVRVFKISHNAGVGFGPLLVAPTATNDALGSKQWQLGAQGTFSAHYRWGLLAALLSYQQPWDGQSNTLTFQPFVFRNIGKGFYLRSSGISNLDTRSGSAVIPIGLGLGKVTRLPSGNLLNLYLEPQYSIIARGDGQPEFQVFSGFNLQFPHKR